jgi:GT2 family glycosyltransferase
MPVYNTPAPYLEAAIQSVTAQLYPHWELCIADDNSTVEHVRPILERFAREDSRIKLHFRTKNGHISAATNDAISISTGEYVGFLDHDDLLAEHALYMVAKALQQSPNAQLIYSDEDKIDDSGNRSEPHFKADWDALMLLSVNYVTHFTVCKRQVGEAVGWLRTGFEGAQDWDFVLRASEQISQQVAEQNIVHIPHILYHWRLHRASTAQDSGVKPYVAASQLKAVQEALQRRNEFASAIRLDVWGVVRVSFLVREPLPRVSVIIPTRDHFKVLRECVSSLIQVTAYSNYEIVIMDNGSSEPETLSYLSDLGTKSNVKVIRVDAPFNYSALNNQGARAASGQVLALLNNDIQITEPLWMDRLVAHAMRPGTGAVGCRLLYPNNTVQHAGVLLGFQSVAGHYHLRTSANSAGYMGRAVIDQFVSAVTGACLFVRRDRFEAVGGLDEQLAVAFNDVDFCLKIQASGLRNVYAGSVTCFHHESISRGQDTTLEKMERSTMEVLRMRTRWGEDLKSDPAYNPNLCLELRSFAIARTPRVALPWKRG